MVSLKEACLKVLHAHPDEYIQIVNEYTDVFQFGLLNVGEKMSSQTAIICSPAVIKATGKLIDDTYFGHPIFQGEYTQYTREEIESILDNSRKAS